jgi:regulator of protease activity HflC (stomatin/prohibitin superfamily)
MTIINSDGFNMRVADNGTAYLAQLQAQSYAQSVANTAQSNAEGYAASVAATAQANAEAFAANGSNISSGTVAAARLVYPGQLPGVTIQADPGGTPSGTYGQIFYFY